MFLHFFDDKQTKDNLYKLEDGNARIKSALKKSIDGDFWRIWRKTEQHTGGAAMEYKWKLGDDDDFGDDDNDWDNDSDDDNKGGGSDWD